MLAFATLLSACAVAPPYAVPDAPTAVSFKEADGWSPAAPADALDRGPWWLLFDDPVLSALQQRVLVSNQNLAAASAAYAQARALVREQRAALFPSVQLNGGATRSGGGARASTSGSSAATDYQVAIGGSWEPDVWGRLRGGVGAASASAEASAADLASATLSAQSELAVDYFGLRLADAQIDLLDATIAGYERALQITRNRYEAGVIARTDVLQAETQLASARADRVGLQRTRAQYEHAVAVLVGEVPANFTPAALPSMAAPTPAAVALAQPVTVAPAPSSRSPASPTSPTGPPSPTSPASPASQASPAASTPASTIGRLAATVPQVPTGVPSTLLQRRPDIAAAERRVAAANAQIGIARAAYFPSLGLSASYGFGASGVGSLFNASNALWSFGLSAAQTLFDAGATRARVAGAAAAYDETVARYRQTVLTAFQDVEDQLAAARVLEAQFALRQQASQAADLVEAQVLNRYRAGQVGYTDVVTAQVTALNARRSLLQAASDRQTTAVALIQALGGGWDRATASITVPTR